MADIHLRRVSDKLDIAYDRLQWMVRQFRGVRKTGKHAGEEKWKAVKFVHSSRERLAIALLDCGASIHETYGAVRDLPPTFDEFAANVFPSNAPSGTNKVGHSAVEHFPDAGVMEGFNAALPHE